jgi:hypothetical protein
MRNLVAFLAGIIATVVMQQWVPTGWWLNSGRGVLLMIGVLFALGVVGAFMRGSVLPRVIALGLGSVVGSAIVLFQAGPGNIWPIVLVFAGIVALVAVSAGAGLGVVARRTGRSV